MIRYASTTDPLSEIATDCLIIGLGPGDIGSGPAATIDEKTDGWLSELASSHALDLRHGKLQLCKAPDKIAAHHVLVVGTGEETLSPGKYRELCNAVGTHLRDRHFRTVVHALAHLPVKDRDATWTTRQAVQGFDYGHYSYTATKKRPETAGPGVESVAIHGPDGAADAVATATGIARGVELARELGNLPPNICNPDYLAERAAEMAEQYDRVELEVLDRAAMQELKMGALLAVAAGSRSEPRLIVLSYRGAGADDAPYAMVGKGITFDTGGICIKPGKGMEEMKYDMCGAAGVLGAFKSCCELKLPINVMAVVPAVENMPDGNAYRPADVVTTMSGKTVEVLNTDAEGRMVLCDALTYVQRFNPRAIIDAATLTGACVVALGAHASGLMTHSDVLAEQLTAAGEASHDRAWRLPIWDEYQVQLDTSYADFSNLGGVPAGSITAGCFLARFTENQEWAHLDVAGTAWDGMKNGATGRPVGILTQFLIDRAGEA